MSMEGSKYRQRSLQVIQGDKYREVVLSLYVTRR